MDGGSGGTAAGMLDHTSDSPSSSRLRCRVSLSAPKPVCLLAPKPSSFDARNTNNDLALAMAAPPPLLSFDPSSSANHKQTTGTGFSSNTVVSSSSSGTIVSTTNTSRSSGSSLYLYLFDDDDDGTRTLNKPHEETEKKRMNNIKSLVQEFFGASSSSSANCTADGGDMSVLERWFTELGVDWVLHISDVDASIAVIRPDYTLDPRSWIRALNQIMETIRLTSSFFSGRGFVGMPSIWEEEEEEEEEEWFFRKSERELSNSRKKQIQKQEKAEEVESCIPDQFQFARFIQETMLRMLAFVDFLVALDPNTICEFSVANGSGVPAPALYQKISILLRVLDALSNAFFEVEVLLLSMPSEIEEVKRIRGEIINLLYAKDNKATEAVWGTMEEIWALIMDSMEEDGQDSVMTTQGSSDIHKLTLSVTDHIRYLWANYWSVTSVVFCLGNGKQHVTETAGNTITNPLANLTTEMVSCLDEKLAEMSQSFADQGIKYLFLINNSTYILQELQTTYGSNFLHSYFAALDRRIEDYIQAYLKLCWVPVLSGLLNPTPHCFGKSYSSLPKFEYEFQKICTTQKLWKVPDPELRKTMRDAITTKIIPGYTRYIEDNEVSTIKLTPQNLEEMLQELFEG